MATNDYCVRPATFLSARYLLLEAAMAAIDEDGILRVAVIGFASREEFLNHLLTNAHQAVESAWHAMPQLLREEDVTTILTERGDGKGMVPSICLWFMARYYG